VTLHAKHREPAGAIAVSSADLSRLTAIVRTCERPAGIERLVRSVRRLYPQLRLLVADDSRQPRPLEGADWVRLPADIGVGAARNAALARVRTPFFLLLEDSMELTRRSKLERLLELVVHGRVDIAAGDCLSCVRRFAIFTSRKPDSSHATFEFGSDGLTLRAGHRLTVESCLSVDLAHNFFVARTDRVRAMGGWDPQLLVDERLEFFVRAQRFGLRVGVCPDVVASRWSDRRASNLSTTSRDFTSLALVKMGVRRINDCDGHVRGAAASQRAA
jgi:hypothetical protein